MHETLKKVQKLTLLYSVKSQSIASTLWSMLAKGGIRVKSSASYMYLGFDEWNENEFNFWKGAWKLGHSRNV